MKAWLTQELSGNPSVVAGPLHRPVQGHRHTGMMPQRYGSRAAGNARRRRTRGWRPNRRSRRRMRIRLPPAKTSAWCTTARCRIPTACAASSSRWASASRPTTTPRPPAASSNGACARATPRRPRGQGFAELDGFYTLLMGTGERAARWSAIRLPASRRRRRDRRLRGDLFGIPLARAPARRRQREALRAAAGADLLMASAERSSISTGDSRCASSISYLHGDCRPRRPATCES